MICKALIVFTFSFLKKRLRMSMMDCKLSKSVFPITWTMFMFIDEIKKQLKSYFSTWCHHWVKCNGICENWIPKAHIYRYNNVCVQYGGSCVLNFIYPLRVAITSSDSRSKLSVQSNSPWVKTWNRERFGILPFDSSCTVACFHSGWRFSPNKRVAMCVLSIWARKREW